MWSVPRSIAASKSVHQAEVVVMRRSIVLLASCALGLGCGREEKAPFRFEGSRVFQPDAAPPTPLPPIVVRLLEPTDHQRIKGEQKTIDCLIELTVPDGGKMPQGVTAYLKRKDVVYDSESGVPAETRGGGIYLLKGKLDRPKKPGRYSVSAQAIDTDLIKPKSDAEEPVFNSTYTNSPVVEIEVE